MLARDFSAGLRTLFTRLVRDEQGAAIIEVVMLVGAIATISLFTIQMFGHTLVVQWNHFLGWLFS